MAGVIGFVVDFLVLRWMLLGGAGFYTGRLVSFLCAVLSTWLFNRHWTFQQSNAGKGLVTEALRYLLAMSAGGTLNFICYAASLELWPLSRQWPVLAVAIGCVAGMTLNFISSKLWVFRKASGDGL
ncbi:GtrA family protein [Pseudomonas nitroreducens]|uniref:GtrA family protein n=1 Tax=Pseudomonas nitroreducens TaxID=46680 RepID=UPI002658620B|nr:GtrA family protein [Pseudomonas nitroreducens]MCP1650793.1 putative flippase GtrA [Pseudomonas nitroreducens]MCP1688745.1 putative flippase GtrA [Pseudomonas nitroreducens]